MWTVYALFAAIIWGLDYVLAERIFHSQISPSTLLGVQMAIGSVVFLTISANSSMAADIEILTTSRYAAWILIAAIVAFIVANLLIALSIKSKSATLAGLLEISYPIFIAIFSWLLFGDNQLNLATFLGGILIFSGVVTIYLFA
jgi:drug/metabolite transporter (DMT)-like permease